MPKLRTMFSSVDEPFCCPTTMTGRPSSWAMPPIIAGSSRHELIDEAVLEEELGPLETLRQLFSDGLARHACARKADERTRFGEDDVAERRERREDTAGRRVGQDADERDGRLVEARDGGDR